MRRFSSISSLSVLLVFVLVGCPESGGKEPGTGPKETPDTSPAPDAGPHRVDSRPPPMTRPVDLWEGGKVTKQVDAATAAVHGQVLVDLGENWTPYLFTERGNESEEPKANTYRNTYLGLAQEKFPKDHHGDRARRDKYLELYGIMPTLGVLRKRMDHVAKLGCAESLDLTPFTTFTGTASFGAPPERGKRDVLEVEAAERFLARKVAEQKVASPLDLDVSTWDDAAKGTFESWKKNAPRVRAIKAAQARLKCEGFLEARGRITPGVLEWGTHEALAEFERRHRIYGWGILGGETLKALARTPLENEREAVIRILTERAMHAAGVIEDGSIPLPKDQTERTFTGRDGKTHTIPNLEAETRAIVIAAFGLETVESTRAWLAGLGDIGKERTVAFIGPKLPEYYDGNMRLTVEIDRGDVWYEFPHGPDGKERALPVDRRPRTTIFTEYLGQRIALARFGTTIGGWRTEYVNGVVMWKYKNSPAGEVIWDRIVAAPVWLPPESTPPKSLLVKGRDGKYTVNYHETGPSYASAYGLVVAYHKKFRKTADGEYVLGGDEGIRSHGSVDYNSIMRRNSHGCHRLHNHIAVRLMSFVLAHRPHRRLGQQQVVYELPLEVEEEMYLLELNSGGYVFALREPIHVNVLEGRIRGDLKTPIEFPIPKFNEEMKAYVLPDGTAVTVARDGTMTPIALPAGTLLPGATVPLGAAPTNAGQLVPAPPAPAAPPAPGPTATAQPASEPAPSPYARPTVRIPAADPADDTEEQDSE